MRGSAFAEIPNWSLSNTCAFRRSGVEIWERTIGSCPWSSTHLFCCHTAVVLPSCSAARAPSGAAAAVRLFHGGPVHKWHNKNYNCVILMCVFIWIVWVYVCVCLFWVSMCVFNWIMWVCVCVCVFVLGDHVCVYLDHACACVFFLWVPQQCSETGM